MNWKDKTLWRNVFLMMAAGGCLAVLAETYPSVSYIEHRETASSSDAFREEENEFEAGGLETDGVLETGVETGASETDGTAESEPTAEGERAMETTGSSKASSSGEGIGEEVFDPDAIKEEPEEKLNRSGQFAIRLNMAYVFAEDTESKDPMDSYAGQVFTALSEKDSAWIAEIYGLSKRSPASVAEEKGISLPPDTEPGSWENVIVSFYNGDGAPISGYSNAKEILSLASVYAYYHGTTDQLSFKNYAENLWESSHRYQYTVSDVYYCDGACLMEDDDEGGETDATAGQETDVALEQEEDAATEQEADAVSDQESDMAPEQEADTVSCQETQSPAELSPAELSAEELNALLETANPAEAAKLFVLVYPDGTTEPAGNLEMAEGTAAETASDENAASETAVSEAETQPQCPGHIDLKVNAYITGLDEKKNLFTQDSIGNKESEWTDHWQGWDHYRRLYANYINQQDWYQIYGLTCTSSMYIRNPLSASEITAYMNMLPEGTSEKRRQVIHQALLSVGCIPYYWGGKPSCAGFDGNGFGTVVSPDKNGRTLRGLDCSGWISWVYWTAFGQHLNYQSTAGLIAEGQAITREQLQPGDIILRTGDDSHVYLFMAWAEDGSMYLIHETGGTTNNVMIGRYQLDWPYYRNLINEE